MRNKTGILSALILSLAIAGSAFAANGVTKDKASAPAAKTAKTAKQKKHHKAKKAKSAKKMKSAMTTTAPKK